MTNSESRDEHGEVRSDDFAFVYLDVDDPVIAWLVYRGVLVSPDGRFANAGHISWFLVQTLRRGIFSTLRREGALEGYRLKEFSGATSRLRCVYAYPTLDAAERGNEGRGKFRRENLVSISPESDEYSQQTYDGQWITDFASLPLETARRYWSGEQTRNPHPESLLTGRFSILGTSVRKRAYETVKKHWPNALALLELARLGAEFNSDFGSISAWLVRVDDKMLVAPRIHYDDKEGPEILRRAMKKAAADPQFHVNWNDLEPFRAPPECRAADERFKMPDCRPFPELNREKINELGEFMQRVLTA